MTLMGLQSRSKRSCGWSARTAGWMSVLALTACVRGEEPTAAGSGSFTASARPSTVAAPRPSPSASPLAIQAKAPGRDADTRSVVAPEVAQACTDVCARSRELKCAHANECRPQCLAMASLTPCGDPMLAFYRCLTTQPTKNWECADDGVAAIRDGFCDKEQGQVVACMQARMR